MEKQLLRTPGTKASQWEDEWMECEIESMRNHCGGGMHHQDAEMLLGSKGLWRECADPVCLRQASTRRYIDHGKIVWCLWHILMVLVPHGVEALDDEALTQEEIQVAAEQLQGHGLSVYIQ